MVTRDDKAVMRRLWNARVGFEVDEPLIRHCLSRDFALAACPVLVMEYDDWKLTLISTCHVTLHSWYGK